MSVSEITNEFKEEEKAFVQFLQWLLVFFDGSSNHIFLSFRGEVTRASIEYDLFLALMRPGIHAFRERDEIDRGEKLKPEIVRVIKASGASLSVMSENYATSTWCLNELELIVEQRRKCNHFVLPVFYHVDPLGVRNATSTWCLDELRLILEPWKYCRHFIL